MDALHLLTVLTKAVAGLTETVNRDVTNSKSDLFLTTLNLDIFICKMKINSDSLLRSSPFSHSPTYMYGREGKTLVIIFDIMQVSV